ncbi:MAG: hypothetical protein WBW04_08665 [Nitrolancea sp.]
MTTSSVSGVGRLILGLVLVIAGAFLLTGVLDADLISVTWPFFIILPGLAMLIIAVGGGQHAHPLAIPGSMTVVVGLILLIQETFDIYASWSYVWTLVAPASVGFGIWLMGRLEHDQRQLTDGMRLMGIGAALFAVGFVFFELVLNLNGLVNYDAGMLLGGLSLVVGGSLIVFWGLSRRQDDSGTHA